MKLPSAAAIGMPLAEVDTPCLMLELDAFERICASARFIARPQCSPSPARESHKCAEMPCADRAGAVGVCVQKVSEAAMLVAGGVTDILSPTKWWGAEVNCG